MQSRKGRWQAKKGPTQRRGTNGKQRGLAATERGGDVRMTGEGERREGERRRAGRKREQRGEGGEGVTMKGSKAGERVSFPYKRNMRSRVVCRHAAVQYQPGASKAAGTPYNCPP